MASNALTNYIKNSIEELRKVTWPTKNQAIRLTIIVLVFTAVVAVLLGALDYVFNLGYEALLRIN